MSGELFRRFPDLTGSLPVLELASLPTPLEEAPGLASAIGCEQLYIKRDDLSGPVYGGNKVRKLEFILGQARAEGYDAVLTYGATGSNHALATSLYAHSFGLDCEVILSEQAPTPNIARTLAWHAELGTVLHPVPAEMQAISEAAARVLESAAATGCRMLEVPFGGSSWRGACGFVQAGLEFAGQWPSELPPPTIYMACGTAGSVAGLALGLELAGMSASIRAIGVTPPTLMSDSTISRLVTETRRELHARCADIPGDGEPLPGIALSMEHLGDGYALPTPAATEAVELIREHAGLKLETTYTGKALGALVSDARSGDLEGPVVFWNTYNSRPAPDFDLQSVPAGLPASLAHFFGDDDQD